MRFRLAIVAVPFGGRVRLQLSVLLGVVLIASMWLVGPYAGLAMAADRSLNDMTKTELEAEKLRAEIRNLRTTDPVEWLPIIVAATAALAGLLTVAASVRATNKTVQVQSEGLIRQAQQAYDDLHFRSMEVEEGRRRLEAQRRDDLLIRLSEGLAATEARQQIASAYGAELVFPELVAADRRQVLAVLQGILKVSQGAGPELEVLSGVFGRLLKSGPEALVRAGNRADLELIHLRGADLAGVATALSGGMFRKSSLDDVDLSDSDLSGANFSEATIKHSQLIRTTLRGALFTGATLLHTDLTGSTFESSSLRRSFTMT